MIEQKINELMQAIGMELSSLYNQAVQDMDKATAHKVTNLKSCIQQNLTEVLIEIKKFGGIASAPVDVVSPPSVFPEHVVEPIVSNAELDAIKQIPELPSGQQDPAIANLHEVHAQMVKDEESK